MDIRIVVGIRGGIFDVIELLPQRPPRDARALRDPDANPNDTRQYEPEI